MQQIFSLSEREFLTGIAPSSQVQDKGLFHKALGIDPAYSLFSESDKVGLLQPGPAATDLTGTVVADRPLAWASDVSTTSTENLYVIGDTGLLYKVDLLSDTTVTCLNTGSPDGATAGGAFLETFSDGTKKLFFTSTTKIRKYGNLAGPPTFGDEFALAQSCSRHPTHRLFDRVYVGDGRYISYVYQDPGSPGFLTGTTQALDFPAGFQTNCLSDDGTYLVAGVTNVISTDTFSHGIAKIIFWDTSSSSWQREWTIPDATIFAIKKVDLHLEAVTSRGVFAFTFYSPPQQLLPFMTTDKMPTYAYPTANAADVIGSALLWGGSGRVSTFGSLAPSLPKNFSQPYSGMTGNVTMVAASAKTGKIFVGTDSSKLYNISIGGSTLQTGVTAETIYIDLRRWWQVRKLVVEFDGQLASGDDVSFSVQPDDVASSSSWGTATYAANGAIRTKEMYGTQEARKLKVIITFNGGAVRIRNLQAWGDPLGNPTHTRA